MTASHASAPPASHLPSPFWAEDLDAWITGAQECGWAMLPVFVEDDAWRAGALIAQTLGIEQWYIVQEDSMGWSWRFQIVGEDKPADTRRRIEAEQAERAATGQAERGEIYTRPRRSWLRGLRDRRHP